MFRQLSSFLHSCFTPTRLDLEIPGHWPLGIEPMAREDVRSTTVGGHPFSRRHLACNTAEVRRVRSPATPAYPSRAWIRVAPLRASPRNLQSARRPWKFASPAP